MIEVEIRTILRNVKEAEKKLEKKCKFKDEKIQTDEYFSPSLRDFYANPKIREYVRIRQGEKPTFEYHKAHLDNGKKTHSEEFEVGIDDIKTMREILKQLGFKPFVTVKKHRKVFECGNFEACLDTVEDVGIFLEVESKKYFGTVEETKQKCINFLTQLGIGYIPAPDKGYPDMLAEKLTQNK